MSDAPLRFLEADDGTRDRLVARLGIDRYVQAGCRVDRVQVVGDEVRLHVAWPRVADAWIAAGPSGGRPALAATRHLALGISAGDVSRPLALLVARIAASLADVTPRQLRALAGLPDAEPGPAAPPVEAERTLTAGEDASVVYEWGGRNHWRRFLAPEITTRCMEDDNAIRVPGGALTHGEFECIHVQPVAPGPLPRFFGRARDLSPESSPPQRCTEVEEAGVIGGGEARLADRLRELAGEGLDGPLFLRATCLVALVGDDVEGARRRALSGFPHGIAYARARENREPADAEAMGSLYDPVLGRLREGAIPRVPGAVALVGFHEGPGRDELASLLAEAGIPVVGTFLPDGHPRRLEEALAADLLVVRPVGFFREMVASSLASVPTARVTPEVPWGPAATRAWLAAVGRGVGREAEALAAADRAVAALEPRWSALRAEAAGLLIAVVVGPSEVASVLDPRVEDGVRLLPLLLDLGFRVRLMVHGRVDDGPATAVGTPAERLQRLAGSEARLDVATFDDPAGLARLLGARDVDAVFSDYSYEARATRAGKSPVGIRALELGFAGALRSLERLVRACDLPFFREHGRRMRPAPGWWR